MVAFAAVAMLPDADVIAFMLRIPYAAPWGHRGASHSLLLALLVGLGIGGGLGWLRGQLGRYLVASVLVLASHGLLDTLTDGGLGVALLWPWSKVRFFAPVRPIPVAPIGLGMLSERGLSVLLTETLYFLPLLLLALWPRTRSGRG